MKASGGPDIQRQVLFACALIALVGLVAASDALHARSQEIIAACEAVVVDFPMLGRALFVLLAMASAMLAFFSSAILVPIGISAWGMGTCFLLLWVGWFLGGVISFGVGRYLGHIVVERMVGIERLKRFEMRVNRNTRFIHIFLFQALLPSEIPGYVLGSIRYKFAPFAVALALAELPYALGTIYIGDSFLQQRSWLLIAIAAAGALLVVAAYVAYRKRKQAPASAGAPLSSGNR